MDAFASDEPKEFVAAKTIESEEYWNGIIENDPK